ncbi:hypothetical protein BD626DRAFT_452983 [Schizophyllum amplum]|uniref:LYR motif-containing protein 2 n=1 Tax=Schizophyllum amplum TaxID=97359 RepID=A0A550CLV6_9AGAR|nr:hypothetical protein BD626DRAFT_452983 [Auriculariopsis ampla]
MAVLHSNQLTLKHFVLRKQVLDFYRYAVRCTRGIPHPQARVETIAWIRSEIERNRHLTDVNLIEDKLRICRREVKQLLPAAASLPSRKD